MESEKSIAVLKKFYSEVHQSAISVDTLTQQLRSCHSLTPLHVGELEACDSQWKKTSYLIDHVVKCYLENGEEKPLDVLLKLIGRNDNELNVLAEEMKSLYTQKSELTEIGKGGGKEVYTACTITFYLY